MSQQTNSIIVHYANLVQFPCPTAPSVVTMPHAHHV